MTEVKPNLDLSYSRLEARICDIERLVDAAVLILSTSLEEKHDPKGNVAMTVLEVTQDRVRELRATYYAWSHAPLEDGASDAIIPSYARGDRT